MSLVSPDVQRDIDKLGRKIKTLFNADLKEICRSENLPVSGVKAMLQNRILERESSGLPSPPRPPYSMSTGSDTSLRLASLCAGLNDVSISGDLQVLSRLQHKVGNRTGSPPPRHDYSQPYRASDSVYSKTPATMGGHRPAAGLNAPARSIGKFRTPSLSGGSADEGVVAVGFKKSPFYETVETLSRPVEMPSKSP
jgi:E3 SUMO-protein ligase PIAS1